MESNVSSSPEGRGGEGDYASVLSVLDRREFLRSVQRAEAEAADANRVRTILLLWARRLQPYLDDDPGMTVAEAVERYRADQAQ